MDRLRTLQNRLMATMPRGNGARIFHPAAIALDTRGHTLTVLPPLAGREWIAYGLRPGDDLRDGDGLTYADLELERFDSAREAAAWVDAQAAALREDSRFIPVRRAVSEALRIAERKGRALSYTGSRLKLGTA